MAKTLYVPDHIATFPPKSNRSGSSSSDTVSYADAVEGTEDSIKLPVLERLPQPTGWRILILPYRGQGKTKAGVLLPDEAVDREAVATVCGYVLKVGPLAYRDRDKFGLHSEPWCKETDWVIFGRYAGSRFKIEGGEVRLLNDDEILARLNSPNDILHTV